mgnify:CR=1 FL=1
MGLMLVWPVTLIVSAVWDFDIHLSLANISIGVITSIIIGILSGMIPAVQASGLDPVEAIRK